MTAKSDTPAQIRLTHTIARIAPLPARPAEVTETLEIVWEFGTGVPNSEQLAGLIAVIRPETTEA